MCDVSHTDINRIIIIISIMFGGFGSLRSRYKMSICR